LPATLELAAQARSMRGRARTADELQLRSHAAHASAKSSLAQPGNCANSTGTKRACAVWITFADAVLVALAAAGGACTAPGAGVPGAVGDSGVGVGSAHEETSSVPMVPTIATSGANMARRWKRIMWLLLLEALGALLILVFIVWWTMFSGRSKGEPDDDAQHNAQPASQAKVHDDNAS
jgi:hypothetical protein